MAIIIKESTKDSKGILIFTHKERKCLGEDVAFIAPLLKRLKERYVIGMHWGWYVPNAQHPPYVDFHLAFEDTVQFHGEVSPRRLRFNSSSFTPSYFSRRPEVPKQWDIISVTRTAKFKNTDQLFHCLRLVFNQRPNTRALVICVGPPGKPATHHNELPELYMRLFNREEREQFSFIYVRTKGLFPVSRRDIAYFYNSSRVFTLFSDTEGQSKVIKEAMLCGLPVVAKAHLKGGGQQFFNSKNSRTFTTIEEGADCFIDLLNNYKQVEVDTEGLASETSETYTVPKFERALRELFAELELPFEGKLYLDNLGQRLPSHVSSDVHDSLRTSQTADVKNRASMLKFLRHLVQNRPIEQVQLNRVEQGLMQAQLYKEKVAYLGSAVLRRLALK
ncbi:MAG: glycosyltransferase [Myxococcales bacterium]|nr:MAG: glycosyltransferase [Myxococcales bacterium]